MSTTIEQLELEVQSNSTSAVSGIDALTTSLSKLKSDIKGGIGLTAVSKQISALNSSLNSVDSNRLNNLAQGLQKLSACGNLKLSSSVATQITNIGNSVKSLSGTDFNVLIRLSNALYPLSNIGKANLNSFISQLQRLPKALQAVNSVNIGDLSTQIQQLVSALTPLTQMGKNNLTSFVTQLQKLPQTMTALKSVNMGELTSQIQQLATALSPLAKQMQSIANGFSAFPARIQRLIKSTNNLSTANNEAATSYTNLAAKIGIAVVAMRRVASIIAGWITKSNEYVESLNLFTVSLGEYAKEAQEYAETVSEVMGIDPAEWLRNQGVFMTLATGFGVVNDRAYIMSKNLTQLGYDLASFFNISYDDAFQKLQSGISGELEPLRRLGFDLSVARLQQEALNLGITKSVNAMTQAEKAELRYYAIMTQVTTAQGDMARTLEAPANQLRILQAQVNQAARSLGNIFIPVLNAVLPYAIAFAKVIRLIADLISSLFGFSLPEIDYSGINSVGSSIGDISNNMGNISDSMDNVSGGLSDAGKKAKELKNALLDIDELNIISPPEDSSSDIGSSGIGSGGIGDAGIGGGGGLGFDLPTYDFISEAVNSEIEKILTKMKEWLGLTDDINSLSELFNTRLGKILSTVVAIGVGFTAWKISKGLIQFLDKLNGIKNFGAGVGLLGFLTLMSDLNEFVKYFKDFVKNGATFQNVVGMISEFIGAIGDSATLLGNLKLGGVLKTVQGIGEIIIATKNILEGDVNWDNVSTAIRGLTNFGIGLGLLTAKTGGLRLAGWSLVAQGITGIVGEIGNIMNAIRTGDWSGVDKVTLIISGLEILGGLVIALDVFSSLKGITNVGKASTTVQTVTTATDSLNTATGNLSPKLTSLAKNLAVGVIIIGEVAAAAILIVGAIAVLGYELGAVSDAWQPVIDNGSTVAIAVGLGTAVIAGVGLAAYALGTAGTTVAVNIGIGTAILVELGIATGLFLVEIWAIGKGLDAIGIAWQPVLNNGETIATGIALGTALLIGIGVVTAALGVATVASVGLLPVAIGLGTALLVELSTAVVLFIDSLVSVANELGNNLAPALEDLNIKLPTLTTNMSDFVDFMTAFAGEVVRYTEASAVAGLSATIDTIIDWFTQDPIEKMAKDVDKISQQAADLNEKLNIAVPELETARDLLGKYVNFIDELGKIAGSGGTVNLSEGLKVNLKEVGKNIVVGFVEGIKEKYSSAQSTITTWGTDIQKWFVNNAHGGVNKEKFATYANDVVMGFNNKISSLYSSSKSSITSWASNIKSWFTSSSYGGVSKETFGNYALDIINGFKNKINSYSGQSKSALTVWATNVKTWFSNVASFNAFYNIAADTVNGFNSGINKFYYTSRYYMRKWANDSTSAFKQELDSNSPAKVFERIAGDTVTGYNNGIVNKGKSTQKVITNWTNSFLKTNPIMKFDIDTSALKYYRSDSFSKDFSANVTSNRSYSITGVKEEVEEFYHEYIEPLITSIAEDVRRQADKKEKTVVQIGNRTISEAVTTQQKANGYVFAAK